MDSFLRKYCSSEWQDFVDFHKTTINVAKNNFVIQAGELAKGLYTIRSGKIKIMAKEVDGREQLIRLAGDGDIVGHRGFGGNWTYSISAIALVDTTVTFLPLNIFKTVAKTNVEFTYELMMFFAEELRTSEENNTSLPVITRVAKAIYNNYEAFGFDKEASNKLSFTLSRKDYASMAGTTYESVIRSIATLNKDKLIKSEGKSIRILDVDALKELSNTKTDIL